LRSRSARVGLLWKPIAPLSVLFKTDYDVLDMGAYPADPVNSPNSPFDITANADQKALDRFSRSVLKVDYAFDGGTKFRSISGYQHGNTTYRADLDGSSAGNFAFIDSVYETLWSQEFNLISPDAGPFTWLLGVYGQKDMYTFPPGQFTIGVPLGSAASEYRLSGKNPKRTEAVFGQVGFQLTDSLKLAVDGRFSRSTTSNDVVVSQYGLPLADQQSAKFTNFSGKVALDWTLNERQFLYAFVADAVRPGGLNVPVGLGLPAPFQAEKVKTVEAGWKSVWLDGRLQSQSSVFFNKYDHFQVTIGYPTFPTFGIELNTANPTHIYGFEEQLQAKLGDGWAARANVGWLHSALGTFYANDPRVASTAACAPASGPASASCINLDGHEQTYAPKVTFSASLERSFAWGANIITPRINYAYVSSQWATLFENRALGDHLGSRNLIGAQVDWANGDFLATLYSTNLGNEHYIAAMGSGLRYAGSPRQYGLRITEFF
jgi:iron complex outermembrane receptor protein